MSVGKAMEIYAAIQEASPKAKQGVRVGRPKALPQPNGLSGTLKRGPARRIGGRDGKPEQVRSTLPRHKRGDWIGPGRTKKSTSPDAQGVVNLSPHELLDRLADLVPPPRKHRHRYHGVFAPNHKLRPAVTSLAIGNVGKQGDAASALPLHPDPGCDEGASHASTEHSDADDKPRSHLSAPCAVVTSALSPS